MIMNKERLQEIKDSIDLQLMVAKSVGTINELAEEEKELYDEVVRLNNVINELEKWLKEDLKQVYRDAGYRNNIINEVLDKLKELKEEK